jgi:cobalt-zinc-cadmium efflux system protein
MTEMAGHNHDHHDHPAVTVEQAVTKAFRIGIALNLIYVVVELASGFITHSLALLTDAGHNFGDVIGLVLGLLALRLSRVKPNEKFTYGLKKTTILAALTNATILLVAIGILGYESVSRLLHPTIIQGGTVALIATIGIIVNAVSAFLFFKSQHHELNARSAYLHLLADALISIGVVASGLIIRYTHWYWLDPAVSFTILLVILVSTWKLLAESLQLSLDAVPKGISIQKVKEILENNQGLREAHHIHVWAMSTTENALTAHVIFDDGLKEEDKRALINRMKHDLLHYNIQHSTLEIESGSGNKNSSCGEE